MEERLRVLEEAWARHEGGAKERRRAQDQFNERLEGDMKDLKECVSEISTNLKVNTVKMGLIFIVVQTVFAAIAVAVVRMYVVTP